MMMKAPISILSWLQTSFLLRLLGVRAERRNAFLESRFFNAHVSKEPVTWFHASSLGELEMLKPLIEDFHKRGLKVGVSAFSDSAYPGLLDLKKITVYADLSPREDEWKRLFDRFKVEKLILAKYDFWPGLLDAASRANAPVIVINAQMRTSLRRIVQAFRFLGVRMPKLFLFPNDLVAEGELRANLGNEVKLFVAVDPRWEQVARRVEKQTRSRALVKWSEKISELRKPIGMIGSAWLQDLDVILPVLKNHKDSLVIVPHDLSPKNIEEIENRVKKWELEDRTLVVNEMGILVELYRFADWVFVGGGFGKGIHSLLEPAIYSVPIACGPSRYYDFIETKELAKRNLLTRCETAQAFEAWLKEKSVDQETKEWIHSKRKLYSIVLEECIRIEGVN